MTTAACDAPRSSRRSKVPIHDVKTKKLRVMPDERGWLMEILRADEPRALHEVRPGLRLGDVSGRGQGLALPQEPDRPLRLRRRDGQAGADRHARRFADQRTVNEFFLGTHNPTLVQVPNLVYHGWKCISLEPSLVVNVPTEPYQLHRSRRIPARSARHAAVRLDPQRWLRFSSPAAPVSSARISSATRWRRIADWQVTTSTS